MAWSDPSTWAPFTWVLYAVGALYVMGFFAFFVAFHRGESRARREGAEATARYNRLLRGFPNGFYAKMMGRKPL